MRSAGLEIEVVSNAHGALFLRRLAKYFRWTSECRLLQEGNFGLSRQKILTKREKGRAPVAEYQGGNSLVHRC